MTPLNGFQAELRRLGVIEKHSRPNHPTTCGKVEQFQQTLKKWLRAQPQQPQTVAELQALCDTFLAYYNRCRPHRALGPPHPSRCLPGPTQSHPDSLNTSRTAARVRRDVIDNDGKLTLRHDGRLHHIGMGRTHARTPVLMLINGCDIRIINATTGEMFRELHLNPAVDYQAQGVRKPRPKPN